MKTIILSLFVTLGCCSCKGADFPPVPPPTFILSPSETFENPLRGGSDPWIYKYEDKYYTCWAINKGENREIVVTESRFLTKYDKKETVWKSPKLTDAWNRYCIWAPEIHHINGKWSIFYAGGKTADYPYLDQRAGVLESDHPFGPYTDTRLFTGDDPEQNLNNDIWGIDMTHLEHNGKHYAIWSGWKKQAIDDSQDQHLYIAEMESLSPMRLGQRVLLTSPEEPWELKQGEWKSLVEGPSILKNGKDVYLMYSTRGSWTINYKVGQLKLTGTDPLDPKAWKKSGPVFFDDKKGDAVFGVGHASFTTSPDNTEHWIYYHSKKDATGGWNRQVYLQPFTFGASGPVFGSPVGNGRIKRPAGEVAIEAAGNQ